MRSRLGDQTGLYVASYRIIMFGSLSRAIIVRHLLANRTRDNPGSRLGLRTVLQQ